MTLKKTIIIFCCLLIVVQSFSQSNTIYGLPVILTSRTNDTTSIFLRTPTKTIPGIAWNAGNGKIEFRIPQDSLFVRDDSIFYQKTNGEQYFVSTISASASAGWNLTGNAGIADTNFLGTTDNEPLIIKVNNSEVFRNGNGYSLWGNGEDNYSVVSKNGVEITKSTTGQSATIIPDYISIINVPNSINVNLGIHGLRPPNMSTTVRGSLAYSTAGNIIWNTDSSKLQYYNGSSWATIGANGITGDVIDTAGHWLNYLYKKTGTDSIFYVKGSTSTFAFIDETNAVRDTAALRAGWGIIIVDDSSYKPNGTDKTIMPDTTKLALKSELNLITNTDTVSSSFIVDTLSNSPPGYATDGYKVLIGTSPTGDFAGHANDVALLVGSTWTFTTPGTNDQLIVDNAKTYSSYQFNGSAWVVTSKLARWGGDKGYGATAFIGRKDNQPFNLRSWNKTFLYGDGNQDVFLPKHIYDSATRVGIYFRPGANGKIDTASFHDLILYRSDFFAISNDTLYVDTTAAAGGISRAELQDTASAIRADFPTSGGGSENFEQTLQNQGSTVFTTDNTVDFDGHTLNLTNLGGQWNIHGINGFGYNNAIGSPATPNDVGIYQSTGAYNSKIVLHENKAQITGDEINISNVAGTDGYTLPTTDGVNGQVLATDGDGGVSWQTPSNGSSAAWGGITGTLSDQTDLQSALDDKFNAADFNSTFNTRFATKTTDDLTQGSTNKYYSDALARAAFTSDKPTLLTYNSSTGHFDLDTTLLHTYNFYNTKYMPLPSSPSNGDILYYNSGWQKLAKGNDGNVLALASGLPTWSSPNYGDSASHAIYAKTDNNLVVKLSLSDTVTSTSTAWQGSPFLEHSATGWSNSLGSSMIAKVQQGIVITGAPNSSWTNFKYSWYMSRRAGGMPIQEAMFLDESLGFGTLNVPQLYATSFIRTNSIQTPSITNSSNSINISPVAQSNAVGNYSALSVSATSNNTSTNYFNGFVINSTQNRSSGTGSSVDLLIHRVETAVSSGTQRFISADIAGSEKFAIDNKGKVLTTTPIDFTTLSPGTPSYSLGTGAGTSATASISGTDADGLITINTGTTPTAGGDIISVTFTAALTNSSKIQLTAYNSPASKTDAYINSDSSGFTIKNTAATDGGSAAPASKTLIFHYTTTQ